MVLDKGVAGKGKRSWQRYGRKQIQRI